MKRAKHFSIILYLLFALTILPQNSLANRKPFKSISIEEITIGEKRIETGREQLIEVLLKNRLRKSIPITVELVIVLPNHNLITFGSKNADIGAESETRVLIPYPINKERGGDYTVSVKVLSQKGKLLVKSTPKQNKLFFAVDPSRKNQQPSRFKDPKNSIKDNSQVKKENKIKNPVYFDPPDLAFQQISLLNNDSVLRGETAHIRLVLTNIGGDVAANVDYTVYWYFAHRPKKRTKFYADRISIIAPGEKKIIEIPVTIPVTEQKGKYFVVGIIDESNQIKETDESNNEMTSNKEIIFSDIALVFPNVSHSFAEDGLFLFQWRSKKYNQFKVQISSNEFFSNPGDIFEIPKGENSEGWTSSDTIKPMSGELPSLALSLMESSGTDFLYWRVKAKDPQGGTTESAARKFFITLKADLQ
ncbi:hypothetical protein KKA14_19915 [bacterium]|nr:hypothetical protein [bacterium]